MLAAYRASVHDITGFTPNRSLLGHEIRLPVDLTYGILPDTSERALSDIVFEMGDRMAAILKWYEKEPIKLSQCAERDMNPV